ncbi:MULTISPECIES: type II secretion system F family protein [unclassified Methylobacterium]|uniref:type II secretion system F family protein n=1 Tax=unclassified Methylobacterium TaxID=2615210 RepID=UPI0011C1D592|nr:MULTISPECIES: type II secretion system F family protein [unclassified Methylobacterium]QEE42005.1 type II secretion system F family protein [Methylobacterium sp. WL1]TXN55298.1 type II secretion system F family protein [Methylobacterium sp. WL2]
MADSSQLPLAAGLIGIAVAAVAYVAVLPLLGGQRRASKRLKSIGVTASGAAVRGVAVNRREQVAKTLSEIEAKAKNANTATLELKLARAGLSWTKRTFYTVSGASAAILGLLLFIVTDSPVAAAGAAFAGGFGVPAWLLRHLRLRRIAKFNKELPNAVDVVVRGIRTGIPVGDCFRMVSREAEEPVRSEFRTVIETQAMGLSLGEAVSRLFERVPTAEVNFFAIVINIQQQSGGNLSEALNNLSVVLRDRAKMRGKVQAMSMEAKASASIIACLPFGVAGITTLTSPDYISLLWTTDVGTIALVGAAIWMSIGVFTIKKMIAFDF